MSRYVFVAIEVLVVCRRRDNRHVHGPALLRLADHLKGHSVRFLFELLPVRNKLLVVNKKVIVADVPPERFKRCGDPVLVSACGRGCRCHG